MVTKESITRFSASNLHPAESCRLIREGAEQAVRRVAGGGMRPPGLDRPATLDLEFQTGDMAEVATWARGAERTGERSVRIQRRRPARDVHLVRRRHLHHPSGGRPLSGAWT